MLKVFLIPMDILQQEIILLTMKDLKIKGYSKQYLNFKDFPLTQNLDSRAFKRVAKIQELFISLWTMHHLWYHKTMWKWHDELPTLSIKRVVSLVLTIFK